MANGNPFANFGQSLRAGLVGFGAGMAGGGVGSHLIGAFMQERERARQMEAMNPLRQTVLDEIRGPRNVFAGGPMSDFQGMGPSPAGPATAVQEVLPGQQVGGPNAIQAQPLPEMVPPELRPPPQIDIVLQDAARRHGVPINALRAIAAQESNFRTDAVNQPTPGDPTDPGARGLFQFTEATAGGMGIDPFDVEQSANATAQMLAAELARGSSIEEAMTAHFGGPDRSMWGPKTQQYMREIVPKFQALEQVTQQASTVGGAQPQAGQSVGPFGTLVSPMQEPQGLSQKILEQAASDPKAFAELFAGEGGIERIMTMMQGPEGFTGTLSPGQVAFQGGQPVATVPKAEESRPSIRVVSGDTAEGQSLGIPPGERARVEFEFNENGNVINRNVMGRFGSGQTINIGPQGEQLGVDVFNKEIETIAEDGRVAMNMLPALDRAGELLNQNVQTGLGQQVVLPIRQLAEDFGVPLEETAKMLGINLSNLSSQEEFRRLTTQLIIDGFAKFKGNLNREEVKLAQDAFANLGTSEDANMRAIAMTRAAAEEAVERRNEILGARTQQQVTEAMKWQQGTSEELKRRANELFTQMQGSGQATAPPSPTGGVDTGGGVPTISSDAEYEALPSGATFIAPDGTTRRKP